MKTQVYQIRALTNLHPGSGDNDYGIVDKLVQRDPTTGYPTIHMSSIKGALREFFERLDGGMPSETVVKIFGSEPQPTSTTRQGKVRFISAELLAYPQPNSSRGELPFKMRCVPNHLGEWLSKIELFDSSCRVMVNDQGWTEVTSEVFSQLVDELPVIARNYLNDGKSKNLWYEEFIPREAIFGCIIQGPEELINDFDNHVNNQVIQIGGNATVGYGYCLFTSIIN